MSTAFNRPVGLQDANYQVDPNTFTDEAFRGEYSGNDLIYKGFARPGASTTDPVWQIAFLTYDGGGNVTRIQWPLRKVNPYNAASANTAAASNDYEFIWDSRASYTYV